MRTDIEGLWLARRVRGETDAAGRRDRRDGGGMARRGELAEERRPHEHLVDGVAAGGVAPGEGVRVVEVEALVKSPWSILPHVRRQLGASHRADEVAHE